MPRRSLADNLSKADRSKFFDSEGHLTIFAIASFGADFGLSKLEIGLIDNHLERCEVCRSEMEELEELVEDLGPPEGFYELQ